MLRFTRHGFREMLIGTVAFVLVCSVLGWYGWWYFAILFLPVLIFLFAFFRDPERQVTAEQHAMVSPADGKVSDITEIEHDELLGGPAIRIGIFLSVFNVHVNRSPCDGKVLSIAYKKGKFINAMRHDEASSDNESNTVVIGESATDKPIAVVKQIVGLIARRIIFTAEKGETIQRGQRIGMIKFGSRTELTIPKWLGPKVKVEIDQTVRGAVDVIATLDHPIRTNHVKVNDEEFEPLASRMTPA